MGHMDIGSETGYPAENLSNFTPHPFTIDGVECASMEGFLQSLKYTDPDIQLEVCKLWGGHAKKKGSRKNREWKRTQMLHWQGQAIPRSSDAYQQLLDRAFDALAENTDFANALLATNGVVLDHSMGRDIETDTVLTIQEFCRRLTRIRYRLQQKNKTETEETHMTKTIDHEEYLKQQLHSSKEGLKNLHIEHRIAIAKYDTVKELLKMKIDSIERQLDSQPK